MFDLAPSQILNLLASILGIIGTAVLFNFSYSLEPSETAQFGDPDEKYIEEKNKRRSIGQRVGIAFLFISFGCSGASVFCS